MNFECVYIYKVADCIHLFVIWSISFNFIKFVRHSFAYSNQGNTVRGCVSTFLMMIFVMFRTFSATVSKQNKKSWRVKTNSQTAWKIQNWGHRSQEAFSALSQFAHIGELTCLLCFFKKLEQYTSPRALISRIRTCSAFSRLLWLCCHSPHFPQDCRPPPPTSCPGAKKLAHKKVMLNSLKA